MKKNTKFLSVIVSSMFFSVACLASNYPASSYQQKVTVTRQEAALFGKVSSLSLNTDLIGYSASGPLSQFNQDHLDVIVTSACTTRSGEKVSLQSTIKIGREWHQAGYLSAPLHLTDYVAPSCLTISSALQIAFSDGQGHWDSSKSGKNYIDDSRSSTNGGNVSFLDTKLAGQNIVQPAWDFIVEKLR